jgi:hypothetical protein
MFITVVKFVYCCCEDANLLLIIPKLSIVVAKLHTFVALHTKVTLMCTKVKAEGRDPPMVHASWSRFEEKLAGSLSRHRLEEMEGVEWEGGNSQTSWR